MKGSSLLDKKELIKSYLLEEGLKDEERKIRFEIAWDVYNHFDGIRWELQRKFFERLKSKLAIILSNDYKCIEIDDISLTFSIIKWPYIYRFRIEKWDNTCPLIVGISGRLEEQTENEKQIELLLQKKGFKSNKWWLGFLAIEDYKDKKKWYETLFVNFDSAIEKTLELCKQTCKIINEGVGELLNKLSLDSHRN